MTQSCEYRETVLVVDDDLEILDLMTSLFGLKNYEALAASNAAEALSVLRAREQAGLPVDQLWTDNRMPGMTGIEFARELREKPQEYPLMRIVLISATMGEDLRDEDRALFDALLPKPFELQDVVNLAGKLRTRLLGT